MSKSVQLTFPEFGLNEEKPRVVNVAAVPHRSPFRYPGGKTWLVPHTRKWLSSLAKKPAEFAEIFAGGGIVGLSALFDGMVGHLTLVELDSAVAAVWEVIFGGQGTELADAVLLTFHWTKYHLLFSRRILPDLLRNSCACRTR
jgi:DNA adenine methylase